MTGTEFVVGVLVALVAGLVVGTAGGWLLRRKQ